jgi:Periplasmic binding protein
MRRVMVAALMAMAMLAACSSDDDEGDAAATTAATEATGGAETTAADTTTADTTAVTTATTVGADTTAATDDTTGATTGDTLPDFEPDPRAPGVTDTEIKVGVAYLDLTAIKDVINVDNGDYQAAYQAMFDDINAEGGIHGRMLVPVYSPINPTGTAGPAAACTMMTQDEPAFVAVGYFGGDDVLCFVELNETAVVGGQMSDERLARADTPWFSPEISEDLEAAVITKLANDGLLDGNVAVLGTTADQVSWENKLQPALTEAGVEAVDVAFVDVSGGPESVYAQSAVFAERFNSLGADQVLVIGNGAGPGWFTGLATTSFRPQTLVTSGDSMLSWANDPANDTSILENTILGGAFDPSEVFPEMGGATEECVDAMAAAGLELKVESALGEDDPQQSVSSFSACRQMQLLRAILERAGAELDYGSFRAAGESLGEIELAGIAEPFNFGPPPAADGDQVPAVYQWDPASATFALITD